MQVEFITKNLHKALQTVNRFTNTSVHLPILSHVAIEATEQGIYFSATDMQLGIRMRVAGKVTKEGTCVIPAKLLSDLVKLESADTILLEVESEQTIKVVSASNKTKLQSMDMGDFPSILVSPNATSLVSITNAQIQAITTWNLSTVATDDSRPILQGVYWDGAKPEMAATDGYRLSVLTEPLAPGSPELGDPLVITANFWQALERLSKEHQLDTVALSYDETSKQVFAKNDEVILIGRSLQGDYPPYQAIIPQSFSLSFEVNTQDLVIAIKRAALVARSNDDIVHMEIAENELIISAKAAQLGDHQSTIPYLLAPKETITVAFNVSYVQQFLQKVSGDVVKIECNEALHPTKWSDTSQEALTYIIMPLKIAE